MRFFASAALITTLAVSLAGCQIVYRLPTRQGNVLEQKDLDKLQIGMTPDQVRFLLGTPIANSPLRTDRWEYLAYYKSPRGEETNRRVTLYFADDKLARMIGAEPIAGGDVLANPDVDTVIQQDKRDRKDKERAQDDKTSGVVIQGQN